MLEFLISCIVPFTVCVICAALGFWLGLVIKREKKPREGLFCFTLAEEGMVPDLIPISEDTAKGLLLHEPEPDNEHPYKDSIMELEWRGHWSILFDSDIEESRKEIYGLIKAIRDMSNLPHLIDFPEFRIVEAAPKAENTQTAEPTTHTPIGIPIDPRLEIRPLFLIYAERLSRSRAHSDAGTTVPTTRRLLLVTDDEKALVSDNLWTHIEQDPWKLFVEQVDNIRNVKAAIPIFNSHFDASAAIINARKS